MRSAILFSAMIIVFAMYDINERRKELEGFVIKVFGFILSLAILIDMIEFMKYMTK